MIRRSRFYSYSIVVIPRIIKKTHIKRMHWFYFFEFLPLKRNALVLVFKLAIFYGTFLLRLMTMLLIQPKKFYEFCESLLAIYFSMACFVAVKSLYLGVNTACSSLFQAQEAWYSARNNEINSEAIDSRGKRDSHHLELRSIYFTIHMKTKGISVGLISSGNLTLLVKCTWYFTPVINISGFMFCLRQSFQRYISSWKP